MSMEIHVLFGAKLPSKAALTRCFKELGFPLSFQPGTGLLEQQEGYLPMRLRGEESGIEFNAFDSRARVEAIAGASIDSSLIRGADFRWGSSAEEGMVAACFAAALAKLVDGVVFDVQAGQVLTREEAIASAREQLEATKPTARRLGTRPSDLRRYLKPLLQQRSELALVDRRLVITPIRHLVRYAFLESTGSRFELDVGWACTPLYGDRDQIFDYVLRSETKVWQPHFEPLLMSSLAEDIFDKVGPVTTLSELLTLRLSLPGGAFVASFVLDGEQERAAAFVEEWERKDSRAGPRLRTQFEDLTRDIEATCARYHAAEAETVRKMKLERFWEPSPFPVEVPAAQRASRCAEPAFATAPWPSTPPWLWQDLPREPGEIRFAKSCVWHGGQIKLLVPIKPDEAEQRHHALESYVLVRQDSAMKISYRGWDRNDPEGRLPGLEQLGVSVGFDDDVGGIFAMTSSAYFKAPDLLQISSIRVSRGGKEVWLGYFNLYRGERTVFDWRSGKQISSSSPLSRAERNMCTLPTPGFGEYEIFVDRIRTLMRLARFGESI